MKYTKYALVRTFVAAVAVFFAVNAQARTDDVNSDQTVSSTLPKPEKISDPAGLRPHLGVTAGIANPEGSYRSAPEFGVDIGFSPYVPFGIGTSYTVSRNVSKSANTKDLERQSILARGTYNFGGSTPVIKNSWVGVAAGPVFRYNGTDLGVAPVIGFDIPIGEQAARGGSHISLGADAKYLALINSDDSDALSVNGVVKYWF